MSQEELIQRLLDFVRNECRTPTRNEFCSSIRGGRHKIDQHFGSWTNFLAAAGIHNNKKIDHSIFERNIDLHLANHSACALPKWEDWQKTLFIGDTHFPFIHQPTLNQIYEFAELMKPEVIVQVGDLFDMYSHAKFPRSHNVFTPREESKAARSEAEKMWSKLYKLCPQARRIQIVGNHDARPMKRVLEAYPEAEDWIIEIMQKMLSFDGVELISDSREELLLSGNVRVIHGYYSQLGKHRDFNVTNVVCGHSHRGGVVYKQIRNVIIWELNAGLTGDPSSKGLSYTAQKTIDWTLGWGWLDEWGPRFIAARKPK